MYASTCTRKTYFVLQIPLTTFLLPKLKVVLFHLEFFWSLQTFNGRSEKLETVQTKPGFVQSEKFMCHLGYSFCKGHILVVSRKTSFRQNIYK